MPPKLTKNSRAVKLLRSKFKSKEVSGDDDPRRVWESSVVFQKHKLPNFRTCFHNIRKEYETNDREADDDEEPLNRRSSLIEGESVSKKRRTTLISDMAEESGDDDAGSKGHNAGSELVSDTLPFKPLFLIESWIEADSMHNWLSIAIVLPSGIGPGQFSVRVVDEGSVLELTVAWQLPLLSPSVLHKKWLSGSGGLKIVGYHPNIIEFQNSLKQLRERSSDLIESVARMPLPLVLQSQVQQKPNLAYPDGTRVI